MSLKNFLILLCVLCVSVVNLFAQEKPPAPSAPKSVKIPAVAEKKLPNGLTVGVVERKGVPIVTIQLLVKSGASAESADKAGLADLTASMLTKGTKTRSASEIAEAIEFLGGSIGSGPAGVGIEKKTSRAACCGCVRSSESSRIGSTQASAAAKIVAHSERVFFWKMSCSSARIRCCSAGGATSSPGSAARPRTVLRFCQNFGSSAATERNLPSLVV